MMRAMRVTGVIVASSALALAVACSSTSSQEGGADAGWCESNGYASPVGGKCAKGTCMQSGTSVACCGSVCATCEDKGLVSYDEAGQCPEGLCRSADVTPTLACCDTCGPLNEAGSGAPDASADAGEGSAEGAALDAPVE
jgi:hypothetical protein